MMTVSCRVGWPASAMLCVALFSAAAAFPAHAVTAQPDAVTFNNLERGVLVALSHNGERIRPETIGRARLLVGPHDYSHMIEVTKTPDGIRVAPSDLMEIGSYELVIDTPHGQALIQVYAPLADLESILGGAEGPGGPRRQALREALGFTRQTGRAQVTIALPPVMTVGTPLRLQMPHDPDREYVWAINGEVLQEGRGLSTFHHTFETPGDFVLSYAERVGGVTVAQTESITRVTEPVALPYSVPRRSTPVFEGPEGYERYEWSVDGEIRGTARSFWVRFDRPGEHEVRLRAVNPGEAPHIIRYRVTVE